ncbi:MAG: hypothetical protein ACW986_02790 [Promethearchaeota archaeon]
MKRRIYYLFIINIIALFVIVQVKAVFANPVVISSRSSEYPILRIIFLTFMFITGTFLEFWLLKLDNDEIQFRKKELLKPLFKINLVTFPLTQILAYIVYIYALSLFWFYVIGIEFAVILLEWFLFRVELRKRNNLIPSKTIFLKITKVNFVSFLVGLIAFIPTSLFLPYIFY